MGSYLKELFGEVWKLILFLVQHWYITLPVFLLLLIIPRILRLLHAVFSNLLFSVRLRLLCKKKHIPLHRHNSRFEIEENSGSVQIRYLWRNMKKRNLYLHDQKTAYIGKPTAQLLIGKWFGQFGRWNGYNQNESALKKIHLHLADTNGKPCILVVNTLPVEAFLLCENTYSPMGSGSQLQNVKVFFGKDFLNYLSRKENAL